MTQRQTSGPSSCTTVRSESSGTISESEATEAYSAGAERRKEMFKAGDLNHDGYVTPDELKDPKSFAQMDTNNDGRISENEYLAWHLKASANAYDKTDSNNDKAVSAQEMENAIQKRWGVFSVKKPLLTAQMESGIPLASSNTSSTPSALCTPA